MPVVFDRRVSAGPDRASARRDRRRRDHAQDQLPARSARPAGLRRAGVDDPRRSPPPARPALAPVRRRGPARPAGQAGRCRHARDPAARQRLGSPARPGADRPCRARRSAARPAWRPPTSTWRLATSRAATLVGEIEHGVLVTELIGQGVNGVTGDYSRGAAGFLIEKGEITRPVSEITIASNLKDMFLAMTPANDLEFRYGINAPTIRIDGMTDRRNDLRPTSPEDRGDRRGGRPARRWRGGIRISSAGRRSPGSPVCDVDLEVDSLLRVRLSCTSARCRLALRGDRRQSRPRVPAGPHLGGRSDRRHPRLSARPAGLGECRSRWSSTASR